MKRQRVHGSRGQAKPSIKIVILAAIIIIAAGLMISCKGNQKTSEAEQSLAQAETDENIDVETEDPQSQQNTENQEEGDSVEVSNILEVHKSTETDQTTIGIDVSRFQGTIDWKQVADAGIDFAMIRVGYRTQTTGQIMEDSNAKYNMQEATANGIQIGAYFFSTAITKEEAIEEAQWTADYISQYAITYPVAFNCEGFSNADSRQAGLTKTERTDLAEVFLTEIYNQGYTPMFYASKNEMELDAKWEVSRLEKSFKIWVSQYTSPAYPDTPTSTYSRTHDMWQYTNKGTVAGVPQPVDVDVAYFGYSDSASAQSDSTPETAQADAEALMNFTEVDETVTAKDRVNLRDIPSQGADSIVTGSLSNGQTAQRTGVSDSGWSRLIIDGQKYYAISNYLTTDLTYVTPSQTKADSQVQDIPQDSEDGLQTKFTDVSENVTPKIEVNLRTLPSVTNTDSQVVVTAYAGDVFLRTGVNTDYGWSRVEYNGQTLYCVSSYIKTVE